MAPRLFDCFTFFDELDVLDLRLRELDSLVHKFVLVEGTLTFSGQRKELTFLKNRSRFEKFLHKIEYVVVDDMPANARSAWDREYFSRQAIMRGLSDAEPNDFVLISDIDEIPKPKSLHQALLSADSPNLFTVFESDCYYFYFNLKASSRKPSLVQAPRLLLKKYANDPQAVRGFKPRVSKNERLRAIEPLILRLRTWSRFGSPLGVHIVPTSAWHFTYNGKPDRLRSRILAYSHTEKATPLIVDTDRIERALQERSNIFDQSETFEEVPLDHSLPRALVSDPERWKECLTPAALAAHIIESPSGLTAI